MTREILVAQILETEAALEGLPEDAGADDYNRIYDHLCALESELEGLEERTSTRG